MEVQTIWGSASHGAPGLLLLENLRVSRGKLRFRQNDLERALRAVRRAGVEARVDIMTDGRISIVPLDPSAEAIGAADEWDGIETV